VTVTPEKVTVTFKAAPARGRFFWVFFLVKKCYNYGKENKTMKKAIFLVLAVAVCFGLFLACPDGDGDDGGKKEYTVTFDMNATGVTPVPAQEEPVKVKANTKIDLPQVTPAVNSTHNFNGWATSATGTALTGQYKVTKNVTLYGRWTVKPPAVTNRQLHAYITIPLPVFDETPVIVDETTSTQYTLSDFRWTTTDGADFSGLFVGLTDYRAVFTLTPTGNYVFSNLSFTYTGAKSVTAVPDGSSVTVTITFTAKGPPPTSAPIKVGASTQNVTVTSTAGATTVTYIDDGYQVVQGNYGQAAYFKVDLGEGKKLSNFTEVKFHYAAIQGDVGYKTVYLMINDSSSLTLTESSNQRVSGFRWWNQTGEEDITCVLGEIQGEDPKAPTDVSANVLRSNAREVYVALYLHARGTANADGTGDRTTFSVTNMEFVPAPEGHVPVSGITGVPDVGEVNKAFSLTTAVVQPVSATNRTIAWSVKSAGTTGVPTGPITTGSFTPTAAGTITLMATIANGLTESSDYTEEFEIGIRLATPAAGKSIALTNMGGAGNGSGYEGTLDGDGFGFTITGGLDYEWNAATFDLDLTPAELKDVVKITFDYIPLAGDFNYKNIYFIATDADGTFGGNFTLPENGCLGTAATGAVTVNATKSMEIVLNYTLAKAIEGSEVQVGFVVNGNAAQDGVDTSFKINNIKFWIAGD
jgi:hypothetical protein